MTKKTLNQNSKYIQELISNIEKGFIFSNNPMNRFDSIKKKIKLQTMMLRTKLSNY